ncbi:MULTISPECIES: 2TM domain-containing protein [Spirulina sp. CCY15215]|uniref:2TM domain-containing protein n=1 Tax=Spirulina sp. CCY15215 TaxID=2767591 RepID=UPI00194FFDC4|nr:2TM domain-containing protein [Spirulina major]
MTVSDSPSFKTYQQEEIQQILHIAIASQNENGELTETQLQEIAADLGISPASLQEAEQLWLQQKIDKTKRQAFNLYRQERFRQKAIAYTMLSSFLVAFDLLGGEGMSWSRYGILVAVLMVSLSGWKAFQTQGEDYERDFTRWETKRQIKQTLKGIWDNVQKALQSN